MCQRPPRGRLAFTSAASFATSFGVAHKQPKPLTAPKRKSPSARPKRGHSEAYFGSSRDFWWNSDFLELMAKRLDWKSRRRILEVGCGSGHWTRAFARLLAPKAEVICIDSDPKWSDGKAAWAKALSRQLPSLQVRRADVARLPFPDDAFDFVTCQTVLIHLSDPRKALGEMLRVLRPGGLLLCVEPDNFAVAWSETSLSGSQSLEDQADAFTFALARHRGRIARGLGNLSLGGRLPGMFAAVGVADIRTYLSDKAIPLYPPYELVEQAALNRDTEKWYETSADLARETIHANYLSGGGAESDFEAYWSLELSNRKQYFDAIRQGRFDRGGGPLMYLVSGTKVRKGSGHGCRRRLPMGQEPTGTPG